MSAALSYPVSALKSSARSRAQILILEPDLAVLDYLRLTLGSQYSLNLFSEEQALLDRFTRVSWTCEGRTPAVASGWLLDSE